MNWVSFNRTIYSRNKKNYVLKQHSYLSHHIFDSFPRMWKRKITRLKSVLLATRDRLLFKYFWKIVCYTMLYILFQYGWEQVLINLFRSLTGKIFRNPRIKKDKLIVINNFSEKGLITQMYKHGRGGTLGCNTLVPKVL